MPIAMEIPSPCVSVCVLDEDSGYCEGCWRTRAEIAGWQRADTAARQAILESLKERQAAAGLRPRRVNKRTSQRSE